MAFLPSQLRQTAVVRRQAILFCVAEASEPRLLFCGGSDGAIHVVNPADAKAEPLVWPAHRSYLTGIARVGKALITGGYDRQLRWSSVADGSEIRTQAAHEKPIRAVVAAPDGSLVASVADDMVCRLWEADSGKKVRDLAGHEPMTPHGFGSMLYAAAFSPDSKLLATADRVGHVVIWEVASGKPVGTFESPEHYTWDPRARRHSIGGIRSLAFAPDGQRLAVGGMGHVGNIDHLEGKARVHLFDWAKGERVALFEHSSHKGLVESLAFTRDGQWLVGVGGDSGGWLLVMNPATGKFEHDEKVNFHVHALLLHDAEQQAVLVGYEHLAYWGAKAG